MVGASTLTQCLGLQAPAVQFFRELFEVEFDFEQPSTLWADVEPLMRVELGMALDAFIPHALPDFNSRDSVNTFSRALSFEVPRIFEYPKRFFTA